jgi:hypothetical protein
MVKVKVYKMSKKKFEEQFGKYAWGVSSLEHGEPEIVLKESIKSKKKIKGTIEHELGHIFSEKRRITQKLPISEKRKLLEMYKQHEEYKKRGTVSGKAKMQEIIADLYGYSRSKDGTRKALQQAFPTTMKIIKRERKKFKPTLIKKQLN